MMEKGRLDPTSIARISHHIIGRISILHLFGQRSGK
jgi:hypothetical protein